MKRDQRGETDFPLERDERGFSLVELIIVIAIMAVLVGTVGAQVIPYLDNTKHARDLQILSAYATAGVAAYSEKVDAAPLEGTMEIEVRAGADGDVYTCDEAQVIADKTKFLVGVDYLSDAEGAFSSKQFKAGNRIIITFDFDSKKVSVQLFQDAVPISEANEVEAKL